MNRALRFLFCFLFAATAFAQQPQTSETIEVTATKIAEDVTIVPASITVIDGDELRARNATDLSSALALAGGVYVAPGGDAGPAGSVPELWGLREVDAYLLVVDGVPWGGAFNPDTPTVDMIDVDRIEILRGSAPVMYGATSFIGVIHVIHRVAGAAGRDARVSGGSYGTFGAAATMPISQRVGLRQSIAASFDRHGFKDDRTSFDRGHVLYRGESALGGGTLRFDLDGTALRQDPNSPHPRVGTTLSPDVAIGTNFNPSDAKIDQNRVHGVIGFETKDWTATLALTRSTFDIIRGFLNDVTTDSPNASGFHQTRGINDLYFDVHTLRTISPQLRIVAGVDHLYGNAHVSSQTFDYFVPLNGDNPPSSSGLPITDTPRFNDRRNFSGAYATAEWTPMARLNVDAGLRLNRTSETRSTDEESDHRTQTRLSGSLGATWRLWSRGSDALSLFADYRNTFKPAALDFGPDEEPDILKPETAHSVEAGVKGHNQALTWQASVFRMDFSNLVIATDINGLPALANAGNERFDGAEFELEYSLRRDTRVSLGYSYHDARFRDFAQDFDGTLVQLSGNRVEMSAHDLLSGGFVYMPARGLNATVIANYVGPRFLNMRNTALAGGYTTWAAGIGWRSALGEIRVDGRNLGNVRPPVAESELGDAQYYLLPARSIEASYRWNW